MKRVVKHLLYPFSVFLDAWFTFFCLLFSMVWWLWMKLLKRDTPEYRLNTLYVMEESFWDTSWWGTKVDHREILRLARKIVRSDWWTEHDYEPITLVDSSPVFGMGSATAAYVNSAKPMRVHLCKHFVARFVILHEVGHSVAPHAAHTKEWMRAYFGLVRRQVGLRTAISLYLVIRPWVTEARSLPDKGST